MPPKKKIGIDKAAWAWAEFVDPDKISLENVLTAYRLNLPKCTFGSCRRNCKGKPFCLSGLGESKWMNSSSKESEEEDLDTELRKPNSFVGLRNLGATCYINSLLQLWFHNLKFRNAILQWNPKEDVTEGINFEENSIKPPVSVIGHLQFLFTVMQFGNKSSVDPSDFIKALDIEPDTQQDAHEFLQLFSCYLEENLRHQSNPVVKNIVKNNFQGEYNYVTRCSSCQTESVRQSTFYELELNVKGHKTLDNCLVEFLKEEKLEGSDKYLCSVCNSKQEATRHMQLTIIPPFLNLHLMRFIYDREKGQKKKVNTCIQFPEKVDLAPYIENSTSPNIYNLSAVLIHKGPSAYSGHYVAHICDQSNGNWYMFNDESASKMEGKIPKLTPDDEDYKEDGKKVKQGRAVKGFLSSSNAYLLVYTSESGNQEKPLTRDQLQVHLINQLDNYNAIFESFVTNNKASKLSEKEVENLKKAEMISFLNTLPVKEKWDAIYVKWLTNWVIGGEDKFYQINNSKLLCPHNKLNFDSISDLKFIDSAAADVIYEKYGGGPRLNEDTLCWECVKNRCKDIRLKIKIAEDQKEISNLLKLKVDCDEDGFWVGKNSLRSWRKKAIRSCLLKDNDDDGGTDDQKMETGSSPPSMDDNEDNIEYEHFKKKIKLTETEEQKIEDYNSDCGKVNGIKSDDDDEDDNEEFNDDLVCDHGNLILEETRRRLVSDSVWSRLKYYFPDCREFSKTTGPCIECQTLHCQSIVAKDMEKQQAAKEKELLSNLFYNKTKVIPSQGTFYVVSYIEFLDPWRKFVRGLKGDRPQSLNNASLLCQHGKLLFDPNNTSDFSKMSLLSKEDWEVLKKEYPVDQEVTLELEEGKIISSSPEVCVECIENRIADEQRALLTYNTAKIYIRQKKDEELMEQTKEKQDIRRSNRKRSSGEKVVTVSSNQTLMDLKIQILNLLSVAPYDQHLSTEDGKELLDHKATLSSLNVFPNSVIYLKIDEATNNPLEDYIRTTEPEHGFKGTCLLKR